MLGGAELVPLSSALLKRSAVLMAKYADAPMDFADATLVALAEERSITNIVTLDHKDFSVYRTGSRKGFTVFPKYQSFRLKLRMSPEFPPMATIRPLC